MNSTKEINKFTSRASEWWDDDGPFRLLHELNPLRVQFILNNLQNLSLHELKILDIGCGGGILCEGLIKKDFQDTNIIGIDPGYENIEIAKNHSDKQNYKINYIHSDLENFESEKKFDVVIAFEVIEHSEDYIEFLKKMIFLAKPGGFLFLSTINRTPKSYLQAIIGAEYILRWLPRNTHSWKKFLKPSEIDKILLQNNCEIQKIGGIGFNIVDGNWNIRKNIDVNYMLVAKKLK